MSFKLCGNQAELTEEGISVAPAAAATGSHRADRESQPVAADMLDYILTLTTELKAMAVQAGHGRLGLILTLAEEEARQKLESRR
jgi:hypothetical protein